MWLDAFQAERGVVISTTTMMTKATRTSHHKDKDNNQGGVDFKYDNKNDNNNNDADMQQPTLGPDAFMAERGGRRQKR